MRTNLRFLMGIICVVPLIGVGLPATCADGGSALYREVPKTLRLALTELEKRFKVSIMYNSDLVNGKFVSIRDYECRSIEESLTKLLGEHGLHFRKAANGFYYISAKKVHSHSSPTDRPASNEALEATDATPEDVPSMQTQLSGKVTDAATGEPLPGVNILLKGTAHGTVTDAAGTFRLSIDAAEPVIVFSYVGYPSKEITIDNDTNLLVSLQQDTRILTEVVVVGYGTQERKDMTGAVSVIKSLNIEKMQVTGLDQALQGQASGVFVSSNSGAPGSDVTVRIRGTGTIGNNTPLYVIDGTPTGPEALNLFNPRDIESIVVLKDAAAASIYGSRAANGVILVTTKKGQKRRYANRIRRLLWQAKRLVAAPVAGCHSIWIHY